MPGEAEHQAAKDAVEAAVNALPTSVDGGEWQTFADKIADLNDKAIAFANAGGPDVSDHTATLFSLTGRLTEKAAGGTMDLTNDGAEIATALNTTRLIGGQFDNWQPPKKKKKWRFG